MNKIGFAWGMLTNKEKTMALLKKAVIKAGISILLVLLAGAVASVGSDEFLKAFKDLPMGLALGALAASAIAEFLRNLIKQLLKKQADVDAQG